MKSSNIGGQAVMEGIMMRSGDQYSIGVRKPDGEIEVKVEPYRSWAKDSSIWKLPVFRGVASFSQQDGASVAQRGVYVNLKFYIGLQEG